MHMFLLLILSWGIAGVDLYLHTTAKAVSLNFTTSYYQDRPIDSLQSLRPLHPSSTNLGESFGNFGVALNKSFCQGVEPRPGVFDVEGLPSSTCSFIEVNNASVSPNDLDFRVGQSQDLIVGLQKAIQVFNNQSDNFRVYTVDGVSVLGPASVDRRVDFRASTLGVKTECESIVDKCNFTSGHKTKDGTTYPTFNCPLPDQHSTWPGQFGGVGIFNLPDSANADPGSFSFGTSVTLDVQSPSLETGQIVVLGDQLVQFQDGFWITIQLCKSTVLNVDYTFYSNTSTFALDQTLPADQNLTTVVGIPFASGISIVQALVLYAAQIGLGTSTTYLESYSAQLSRFTVALAYGVIVNTPSRSEAWWETQIVTRVPKIPLFLLEFLLLVYALLGCILVALAWITNHKSSRVERQNQHGPDMFAGTARIPPAEVIHTRLVDPTSLVLNEIFDDVSGMHLQRIVLAEHASVNKSRSILKLLTDSKLHELEELAPFNTAEPGLKHELETRET
jgi:hypothetical protein